MARTTRIFDRFQYTNPQRDFMNKAVELRAIDAVELAVIMHNEGGSFAAISNEIMMCAFNNRHSAEGQAVHAALCSAADAMSAQARVDILRVI